MSIKTTLTNPPTIALIALQIIGGLLILASIVGFRSGGMLWPMLGSGAGTWLVILGWDRTREKRADATRRLFNVRARTAETADSLTCSPAANEIMSESPPGVWEDHEGTFHFDIATLLQHLNVLDTPENRAALEEELRATIEQSPEEKPEA
jgi:hypothetical protein